MITLELCSMCGEALDEPDAAFVDETDNLSDYKIRVEFANFTTRKCSDCWDSMIVQRQEVACRL